MSISNFIGVLGRKKAVQLIKGVLLEPVKDMFKIIFHRKKRNLDD